MESLIVEENAFGIVHVHILFFDVRNMINLWIKKTNWRI